MEKFLETATAQAPGIVVLYLLVQTFLRRDKERDSFIQQLHAEHLAARGESREAIKDNTNSNKEVVKAVDRLSFIVKKCSGPAPIQPQNE